MRHEQILDAIYEAGAFPERWPVVLGQIASFVGARGGNFIHSNDAGITLNSSAAIAELAQQFAREGWNEQNSRIDRLLQRVGYPGFLTDRDIHTEEEIASFPIYRDFLTPHGADAGAATLIQGGAHDAMIVTMEIFPGHAAAAAAVPTLDGLRPHIARSVMIGSQIQAAKVDNLLRAFELVGLPVALLGRHGRVISATTGFSRYFDDLLRDGPKRLRIVDGEGDIRLADELLQIERGSAGCSVAIRDPGKIGRAILHLIPARLDARDLFTDVWTFAILAHPDNRAIPGADLIAALFDLTPAEARVARAIASGQSLAALAVEWRVSEETIRSQLKKVFAKTSTRRQSELAALVSTFSSR